VKKFISLMLFLALISTGFSFCRSDYSYMGSGNLAIYQDADGINEVVMPFSPCYFYEDFLGGDVVIPAFGSAESGCKWVKKIVGSGGTPTVVKSANFSNGVLTCTLQSSSENEEALACFNDQCNFTLGQGLIFECRARMTTLTTTNAEMFIGLGYAWSSMAISTYRVGVYTAGTGILRCETDDNATNTQASSGVTVIANQWFDVKIDCQDVKSIKFYINGDRVARSTTFAYADTTYLTFQPILGVIKSSTGIGTVDIDFVRIWQNRS